MQFRPFDPATTKGVDGCSVCSWAIEGAKKLVAEGKPGVQVNYPDGRAKHISGFGYGRATGEVR